MLTYRQTLATIFSDIKLVYRNFWHWNLSKIVLFAYAILASIVCSLPFLGLILLGLYLISPSLQGVPLNNPDLLFSVFFSNIPTLVLIFISGLVVLSILVYFFSYYYYLLSHVYRGYMDGKKLGYFENHYFSWKHIWKFMALISWVGLYLLAPIVGFFLIFLVVSILSIWTDSGSFASIALSSVGFISLLVAAFAFIYLAVRLVFASFSLVESADMWAKTKHYIDESMALTKKSFWKTLGYIAPFMLGLVIINKIIISLQESSGEGVSILLGLASFFLLDGLIYMVYYSLYRILKNNQRW